MWGGTTAESPSAGANASRNASTRALVRPSHSPNSMRGTIPVCLIRPGPATKLMIRQRPPRTRPRPMTSLSSSAASTPFWSGTTNVAGPSSGPNASAVSRTCQAFTPTSTASTGPISRGSDVASTGWTAKSPATLSTVRPSRRSASRCAPRATKATEWPARARRPPK